MGMIEVQSLVNILHVDGAKRVEGTVIEAAATFMPDLSFDFGTAGAKG